MSLTIEGLKVIFEEEVLKGVSLDIRDKEFVSLLGASGCGKSTLLKSIAGLLSIEEGTISIDGQSLMNVPPQKRGTVVVFQDLRLFPHMTVEKNIAFPMELQKIPKKIQNEMVSRFLLDVQLPGYGKRKIKEMSGGQLQRVALARALAAAPKVLLLDEPFSGLDEKLRSEMGNLVRRLHNERNLTTILVTHDKEEAFCLSDRIAFMDEGEILQYDTPEALFYKPSCRTVAEYFGKVMYIKGEVEKGVFKSPLFQVKVSLEDGLYEAMARPFSVALEKNGGHLVSEVLFMGEMAEVKLMTPQGPVLSRMMSRELVKSGVKPGDKAGIKIREEEITWLRRKEENTNEKNSIRLR